MERTQLDLPADLKEYPFGGEYSASARINLQHFFWWRQQGYLLHPQIVKDLSGAEFRVADLGAGTGIWAVDVAKTIPTAHIDGFDVDLSSTPPPKWTPESVSFQKYDVFHPVPHSMVNAYDVVAVRLFVCVVRGDDPRPILHKAWQMLKPGGWLQWSDTDFQTFEFKKTEPSVSSTHNEELQAELPFSVKATAPTWVARLAELVKEAGFESIEEQRASSPQEYLPFEQDNYLMVLDEISAKRLEGQALLDYHERVKNAHREIRTGVARDIDKVTVIGRKPL